MKYLRPEGRVQSWSANRRCSNSKFLVDKLTEEEAGKQSGVFLGRKKVGVDEDTPFQRHSIYPLVRQNGNDSFHIFTATLVDPFKPSKVAVIDGSNCQMEIEILQKMGCYGYAPEVEARRKECASPSKLFLFDTEMFFLLHGLGVLRVRIPKKFFEKTVLIEGGEEKNRKTPTHHLWDLLSSPSNPSSEPPLAPFHLRYAAYLYYRSRGWIVRPSLTLGGVDFLLYAESPCLRHAAYVVIVMSASNTRSARDIAAHLRVTSSVAKRLIIAEIAAPTVEKGEGRPWEKVKNYTIEETLLSRTTDLV
ncbi:potential trna splicing endonuclease subunit [Echinococcus multilocularis]|uniref:tRNA-intron lyase n=2 Tax=Echinococcus multilocularis TaxID=6211 RepID=A0A068Y6Z6_ECHMU|nr:potential trna splicing endonuclease subunit [Echinococcus multilocularis]